MLLLEFYGGNSATEGAVNLGLEWLVRNQLADGSWELTGPFSNGGRRPNRVAATAMALIAFQGVGSTPQRGRYKEEVKRGWTILLPLLDKSTGRFKESENQLYTQALATIALCELYGMTEDPKYRAAAQMAIDYAVKAQHTGGGWRYRPGEKGDLSVTGWFVMALQSALMGGLKVPEKTLALAIKFLDQMTNEEGVLYGYQSPGSPKLALTAEGLLSRQYLGWLHQDARLIKGVEYLSKNPINYNKENVYYWYYATQVMHHMGGKAWSNWNAVMQKELPGHQVMSGKEKGSWTPGGDQWGRIEGRLYTTCLSIYMLEVYYRPLPLFSHGVN